MYAIITGQGKNWTVNAPGRMFSGFGSFKWAERFAENMGYMVWIDPDV